jgi:succinate-semialdehyde dehydrogenase / glutarate-semialdehyde dehydrogenase
VTGMTAPTIQTVNPTTEEPIGTYGLHGRDEVDEILTSSADAARRWRQVPIGERCRALARVGDLLARDARVHAQLITTEMGKPIGQSEFELGKCVEFLRWFATADDELSPRQTDTGTHTARVRHRGLGVVLAIMPWNFPFMQPVRLAGAAIAAGNSVVVKHAPATLGSGLALADVFREAGLGELFRSLVVDVDVVADVIADDRVAAVSLTGSARAGTAVAAAAGRALKPCVLELGGSDPFIVLDDADVDRAASEAAAARLQNSGQSCIAAKRFIVEAPAAERFIAVMVAAMEGATVGDPCEAATTVGPLARADLRDALVDQVRRMEGAGASVLTGGRVPDGRGWFFEPTVVLAPPTVTDPVFAEEVFGPAAVVFVADDAADAVRLANDSPYGLGASVWTASEARAQELADELDVGMVWINDRVRSDPRLPFGGVKRSGFGRELGGEGLRTFTNVQSVARPRVLP